VFFAFFAVKIISLHSQLKTAETAEATAKRPKIRERGLENKQNRRKETPKTCLLTRKSPKNRNREYNKFLAHRSWIKEGTKILHHAAPLQKSEETLTFFAFYMDFPAYRLCWQAEFYLLLLSKSLTHQPIV
jgi:hypothetical protein